MLNASLDILWKHRRLHFYLSSVRAFTIQPHFERPPNSHRTELHLPKTSQLPDRAALHVLETSRPPGYPPPSRLNRWSPGGCIAAATTFFLFSFWKFIFYIILNISISSINIPFCQFFPKLIHSFSLFVVFGI